MKLTAIVLTKDEEKNIGRCLEALRFCDEIIVVDDGSQDSTVKLAKKHGANVYTRQLAGDFASQRNFGLSKASGEWVLFVDADEVVGPKLKAEILHRLKTAKGVSGYKLKRYDRLWGKELKHGEIGAVRLLRLAKKDAGLWARKVHEVWDIKGNIGELSTPLLHYPHQTLGEFIAETNFKSTMHAEANLSEGKRSSLLKVMFWPAGKFLNNYLLKLGFLDGTQGFIVAMVMSFHSFLAWGKLWLLQKKKD